MSLCAICKKPFGTAAQAKSRSGKVCHEACLQQAKAAGAGGASNQPPAPRQPTVSRRDRSDKSSKKPSPPKLQMPTLAQILRVSCPACQASPGTACTLRGGHQARAEAYRAVAGEQKGKAQAQKNARRSRRGPGPVEVSHVAPGAVPPPRPKQAASPFQSQPARSQTCPRCEKPIGPREPVAPTEEGHLGHYRCVTGHGFDSGKALIESGETFRARRSSGWRLGGSPSSAGEIKR
ncbi:hypothetical protein [Streptomyces sp. IBSBF 3136]|uniref:hypothetical protein n=1 Tax=Streptomyces sp. IBSBF 3136 TaxID=2903524 RepID=UPI003FA729C3